MTETANRAETGGEYPYASTPATRMLSDALDARSGEGTSLRKLAGQLGYKSAVVVSHMRTGRLPIPVDRAVEIAKIVEIDPARFLMLVLEQRYPDVDFKKALATGKTEVLATTITAALARMVGELEALAGTPIDELAPEHLGVLREVVADRYPRRRWLGVSEVTLVELLRKVRPDFARDGIGPSQATAITKALKGIG